jgi:hypothetical protein
MHAQSPSGNPVPTTFYRKPLSPLTTSPFQDKMSKLRKQRWDMWRGVVSHSRDIVEQSFSSSPAKPFAGDVSIGDSDRPQEERMETLSRVQKYVPAPRCARIFELFEMHFVISLGAIDTAADILSKKSPVAATASSSSRKLALRRQHPPTCPRNHRANTSDSSHTTLLQNNSRT